MKQLGDFDGFLWDKGNRDKNWIRHGVYLEECEEAFFDPEKKIFSDALHSGIERRYILLAKTMQKRLLFIVFTIRGRKVRVVSARDLNKKEYHLYEKET